MLLLQDTSPMHPCVRNNICPIGSVAAPLIGKTLLLWSLTCSSLLVPVLGLSWVLC